ncbi:MAG TPA: hypothetical protein VMV77_02950 [Bacteroidales bacterium]|nr:hypothetical protein [Bacteroidales bacterium]
MNDINHSSDFYNLSEHEQNTLTSWIDNNIFDGRSLNKRHSSYGMKHIFEHDPCGFYVTNGMFKGAMMQCGFLPGNAHELNWYYRISEKSPAFRAVRS